MTKEELVILEKKLEQLLRHIKRVDETGRIGVDGAGKEWIEEVEAVIETIDCLKYKMN